MANKKVTFIIDAKTGKAQAGMAKVDKSVKSMSSSMKSLGKTMGLVFGIGASISFLKSSIDKFIEQEKAIRKLDTALGKSTTTLQNYASELQKITATGDEVILGMMAQIGMFVKDEDAIKRLTVATLDMAVAQGMDMNAAAQLVAKSLGSSTNALSRYGVEVTGSVGSTERLETALKNMNDKFSGQAAAAADTFGGKIKTISDTFGDMQEVLIEEGGLIEAFDQFTERLDASAPIFLALTGTL